MEGGGDRRGGGGGGGVGGVTVKTLVSGRSELEPSSGELDSVVEDGVSD